MKKNPKLKEVYMLADNLAGMRDIELMDQSKNTGSYYTLRG